MTDPQVFIHPSADVAATSKVGAGTRVWHQAQVMDDVEIGEQCTLGKGVFVGVGSRIGALVKIGNYANIFGARIADEAFIGPQVCIMEDREPRATNLDGTRKGHADFTRAPATIEFGASLGAGALIMPGVTVGRFAMISAGAVVNRDVPAHAIMAGNPARQVGYACRCGRRLAESLRCELGHAYRQVGESLELLAD